MKNRLYRALFFTAIVVSVPLYMIFSVPKYPILESSMSQEQIIMSIKKVIKENSNKYSFENMDNRQKIVNYEKELNNLARSLDKCSSKECMIDEYNSFMDDWVADTIKVQTRYYAISNKFGMAGNFLNQSFPWLYQLL